MAIVNGYATLAEAKAQLSELTLATNATDDGVIEDMVEAVCRFIDKETERRFYTTSSDETRTYSSETGDIVYTDDLLSITTLKTDDDGDRTYEVTWATTDYDLLPENAAVVVRPYISIGLSPNGRYSFPTHAKSVQIAGKFGFCTAANQPDDIKQACLMIVVNIYQSRRGIGSTGAATITGAGVVITPKDVPYLAQQIINSYKRSLI